MLQTLIVIISLASSQDNAVAIVIATERVPGCLGVMPDKEIQKQLAAHLATGPGSA